MFCSKKALERDGAIFIVEGETDALSFWEIDKIAVAKLLQSPISKTDSNLQLEDYLIDRISKGKNKKSNMSKKILIDTLCKNINITDKKQKQRLPEKLKRYLEHYKKCGFIKNYHLSKDSITFDY